MPMTAHFHVIQQARARTSSRDTFQWYRMPPLKGPIASLYWTRYPVKTRTLPSSILTGKCTVSSRRGLFKTSRSPESKFNFLPARSICSRAMSKGFSVSFTFTMRHASRTSDRCPRWPRVEPSAFKDCARSCANDSHRPRPKNDSAAQVLGCRLRIIRWIDEVVRFLTAKEPQHVIQRGLHRAPSLARDEGRDVRRHDDVRKILERTMERPSVLRVGVCPPRVEGGPKPRTGFEMFEQIVFDDQLAAGDVHENRVLLHACQEDTVHETLGRAGERERKEDHVCLRQVPGQILHRADGIRDLLRGRRPSEPNNMHVEGLAAPRDF